MAAFDADESRSVEARACGVAQRRAYALVGVEQARYAVARAQQELAEAAKPLTDTELDLRRSGEEQLDIEAIRSRRAREHVRRRAAATTILQAAQRDRIKATAALTAAEAEVRRYPVRPGAAVSADCRPQ